jgi:hypothetical protein
MNNLIKLIIIVMVASMFGCQSVSPQRVLPQRLQYLKGADPNKDTITIVDHEYFDVQNLSIRDIRFDEDDSLDWIRAESDNLLTKHEYENISEAYIITAKNYCSKQSKFLLNTGIKVELNTTRYRCVSEDEALEESFRRVIKNCEWARKKLKRDPPLEIVGNECAPSFIYSKKINGYLDGPFCKKYTEIMSSTNELQTCGSVEPRIREYLLKSKNRPQIDIGESLNAAKEKCGQLGFAVGTEAFGKCVLQLSSQ